MESKFIGDTTLVTKRVDRIQDHGSIGGLDVVHILQHYYLSIQGGCDPK